MMSEFSNVLDKLYSQSFSKRNFRLEEILPFVVQSAKECDRIEAENYVHRNKKICWNEIVKRIDEEKKKGIYGTFEIADENRFELIWYPYLHKNDTFRTQQIKRRLSKRGIILNYLDDSEMISSRDYEALGCVISILSGATYFHLTPKAHEFGIDFLALIPAYGRTHLFRNAFKQVRIVGQSKKWNSKIGRDEVELLSNRLEDIRRGSLRILEILPPWFVSTKGVLIGLILSHRGTQIGGHEIADDHGIILADRRDVAEIIALARRWNVFDTKDSPVEFLRRQLDEVLTKFEFSRAT